MTKENVQATGNFLSTYYSDLNYIRDFHRFKNDEISAFDYTSKKPGSFYSFVIEFRIVRNFSKGSVDKLLRETIRWVNGRYSNDVDKFAQRLSRSGLTRGHVMTSLASKILFLNDPWTISPMDSLVRSVLNQKDRSYSSYSRNFSGYKSQNDKIIKSCIKEINPLMSIIEKDFKKDIRNVRTIGKNRLVDKFIWTAGK